MKIINDDNSSVESKFVKTNDFFCNLKNNYKGLDIIRSFDMTFFKDHKDLNEWLSLPGLKIANCKTLKGFGFEEMYNNPKWHAGIPNDLEYSNFISTFNFNLKDA